MVRGSPPAQQPTYRVPSSSFLFAASDMACSGVRRGRTRATPMLAKDDDADLEKRNGVVVFGTRQLRRNDNEGGSKKLKKGGLILKSGIFL